LDGTPSSNKAAAAVHDTTVITALTLFALSFGALCSWLLTTGITRPLREALALAETVAAAADSLQEQAHGLAGVVSVFKLRATETGARPPARTRAAAVAPTAPVARAAARKPAPPARLPGRAKAVVDDEWETF
jgi:methyl-accepting chemotaxis protein